MPLADISFGWRHWALPVGACFGVVVALTLAGRAASWVPETRGGGDRTAAERADPPHENIVAAAAEIVPPTKVALAADWPPEPIVVNHDSPIIALAASQIPAAAPAKAIAAGKRTDAKVRPPRSAAEITAELAALPEIGLHTFGVDRAHFGRAGVGHPALALFDSRPDLGTLPLLRGEACELSPGKAQALRIASSQLRGSIGRIAAAARVSDTPKGQEAVLARPIALVERATEEWPSLVAWMMQAEGEPARRTLIELLSKAPGPAATRTLAARAVFDPAPDLRRRATLALRRRPADDARPFLLAALQYPWPAAADHAAAAFVAMKDVAAVPDLVRLLSAPDPAGPCPGVDGESVRRDMVRINHSQSCQLCHAPSSDVRDSVRAPVPSPDRSLPFSFDTSRNSYYAPKPPPSRSPGEAFIRAEVTYLRPDFSIDLPVESPGPWPKMQRYDFVVRTRGIKSWEDVPTADTYPQRESVLRALRTLTGSDFGDRAEDWRAGLRDDPRFEANPTVAKGQ
jgi:hypothetical protein